MASRRIAAAAAAIGGGGANDDADDYVPQTPQDAIDYAVRRLSTGIFESMESFEAERRRQSVKLTVFLAERYPAYRVDARGFNSRIEQCRLDVAAYLAAIGGSGSGGAAGMPNPSPRTASPALWRHASPGTLDAPPPQSALYWQPDVPPPRASAMHRD